MSLSRLNQLKQKDSFLEEIDSDFVQEQKVKKQEIKLISEKKFYDILNAADNYDKFRKKERTKQLLESRGIKENFLSFKNYTFEPPLHEQLAGTGQVTYRFKTDNDICKYSSNVHIKEDDGALTLNFLINLLEHPTVRKIANDLQNLTAFAINHNAKIYAYEITSFKGIIRPNENEIYVVFEAKCKLNGEYVRELSSDNKTMHKDDLIDPKTFML